MVGRTNVSGVTVDTVAVIKVTYPVGSVCTCTDGTVTLRAKDTSGLFIFDLPNAGTWTITITNGVQTKSVQQTVSVGTLAEVSLSYILYLYSYGDNCTDVTGGWELAAYNATEASITPYIQYVNNHVAGESPDYGNCFELIAYVNNSAGIYRTVNPIDLTMYNTVQASYMTYRSNSTQCFLGIIDPNATSGNVAYLTATGAGMTWRPGTIDISNLTGEYYVAACCWRATDIDSIFVRNLYLQ
jgi:hypothetical protein